MISLDITVYESQSNEPSRDYCVPGLGMRLHHSHETIKAHGKCMELESQKGKKRKENDTLGNITYGVMMHSVVVSLPPTFIK